MIQVPLKPCKLCIVKGFSSWGTSMARRANRRGIIVVLAAVLLVVMLAMIAFAVDVGFITVARTELQGAADAAALAGVSKLPLGESEANVVASDYVGRNIAT